MRANPSSEGMISPLRSPAYLTRRNPGDTDLVLRASEHTFAPFGGYSWRWRMEDRDAAVTGTGFTGVTRSSGARGLGQPGGPAGGVRPCSLHQGLRPLRISRHLPRPPEPAGPHARRAVPGQQALL